MFQIEEDNLLYMTYFLQLLYHLDQMVIVKYLKIDSDLYIYLEYLSRQVFIQKFTKHQLQLFIPGKTREKKRKKQIFLKYVFKVDSPVSFACDN
jgi:hypothetical protein